MPESRCWIVKAGGGKGPVRFVWGGEMESGLLPVMLRDLNLSRWNDVGLERAKALETKRRREETYILIVVEVG